MKASSNNVFWLLIISIGVAVAIIFGNNTLGFDHPIDYYTILASFIIVIILVVYWAIIPHGTHTLTTDHVCLEKMTVGRSSVTYSMTTKWMYASLLLVTVAIIFGFFQEMYDTTLDERSAVDFWSLTHFLFGCALFIVIALISQKRELTLLIVFLLLVAYEFVEAVLMPLAGITAEFYAESWGNIVFDVVIGTIGMFVGYGLTRKNPCDHPNITAKLSLKPR